MGHNAPGTGDVQGSSADDDEAEGCIYSDGGAGVRLPLHSAP